MNTSSYKHGSYLHCRVRICSFNFKNGYPLAATKVQILFKEVFARGPTRALSGSYVVNWSLELILDTANAQKKSGYDEETFSRFRCSCRTVAVAGTKVQILLKEVFARGPTRALSGSYVVNWSLELILDTTNAQKKS